MRMGGGGGGTEGMGEGVVKTSKVRHNIHLNVTVSVNSFAVRTLSICRT